MIAVGSDVLLRNELAQLLSCPRIAAKRSKGRMALVRVPHKPHWVLQLSVIVMLQRDLPLVIQLTHKYAAS